MDDLNIDNILTNQLSKKYYDYNYSFIQLKIPQTYEIFNIGIIVENEKNEFRIKHIPSVFKLSNCLTLSGLSGIDFSLKILIDRLLNYKKITVGKVSEILHVSEVFELTTDKLIDDTAEELFGKTVSIMKSMDEKSKTVNNFDKPHILGNLKEIVKKNKFRDIEFNKKISNVHKKIDTLSLVGSKPIVAAEVISPYVNEFFRNFGESYIVMQELNNVDIKVKLLYMPRLTRMDKTQISNYKRATAIANNGKIEVIDTADYSEFISIIDSRTQKYRDTLF